MTVFDCTAAQPARHAVWGVLDTISLLGGAPAVYCFTPDSGVCIDNVQTPIYYLRLVIEPCPVANTCLSNPGIVRYQNRH